MRSPMEGRVPPHNLDAEASVLGSVLLDSEALDRLEGFITADAFYKEAHRKIWEAMALLRARRDPVDLVTLSAQLRTAGDLEDIGGLSYLVGLSESTPTAAYADYYGRIVAEKWTLRKLITAAGEAMKMAYDEEGSLEDILDTAGRKVLEVSTLGARTEFQSMKELVHQTFEHIQLLYENKGQTDGIKSGFRELDSMIGGLTPGSLNIIAARPSMGKTALALSMAQNVALRSGGSVAVFSLEMPAVQLVTRMLCSEARIDMNRLRQGLLTDRDFSRLVDVAGRIAEAAILIDDSSDLTLMELRARARRLHAQHRLGLIVIDYLQLMSGPNTNKNTGENRQQEIAQISRGLKGLARELSVPVLALSQLSRAVESRPNKRPMLSDLRESGCLAGDSLVQLADGPRVPIRSLVGQRGFEVLALNKATQKLDPAQVSHAFSTGVRPVFRLTTRLGRTVRATANHKFLTVRGWKRLDELLPNDYLALPRLLPVPGLQTLRDAELVLLGRQPARLGMATIGMTHRELHSALGMSYGGMTLFKQNLSRERAGRIARATQSGALKRLAQSDIYWDTVVSVVSDGVEEVFDLTVPGLHNFVADNIIVHNSIEQDADLVMFIYRDEYYNQHSEKAGIAEIIVGKQRNGPTGVTQLQFHAQHVRFNELARDEI
jgi:replicative DNA helicase